MRKLIAIVALVIGVATAVRAAEIPVLTYHDIVEKTEADPFAVTVKDFVRHMRYLKEEGYTPVSLVLLDQVRVGKASLPVKPVLLTFDDGLVSFTRHALPVLRQYNYPSVLSIVTAWADGNDAPEAYRGRLLGWKALKELADSPLVEIISHSDNLHRGIRSNPQGNQAPAGVTRAYDPKTGRYETEDAFRARISADLSRSRSRLVAMLGREPVAVAWPYGAYDNVAIEEARRLGMKYHLTLDADPTMIRTLPRINRTTFKRYRDLRQLDDALTLRKLRTEQLRFVEITLDEFAGRSPADQDEMLSALLSRLQLLRVNAVVVDPFTRDRKAAFFPGTPLPVAANILNRVLHQVEARNEIMLAFLRAPLDLPVADLPAVYRELARLHRFRGVIFSGEASKARYADIEAILRFYRPAIKIGFAAGMREDETADFVVQRLDAGSEPGAIAQEVAAVSAKDRKAFFVLERSQDVSDAQLVAAMRALRHAGAAHYGYTNDEYRANRPDLMQVVRELNTHTVTGTRR